MTDAQRPRHLAHGRLVLPTAVRLALRNLPFTVVVPGLGAVWIPWWILTRGRATSEPVERNAVALIAVGAALYLSCLWMFAVVKARRDRGPTSAFTVGSERPIPSTCEPSTVPVGSRGGRDTDESAPASGS
jgi:hypothetical protein